MSIVELSFLSLTHAYFSIRVQLQRLFEHWRITWKVGFCMCPGRRGKKTDILDLFWHFSIKVISECFNWCAGRWNQLGKKVALANTTCLIEKCQNRLRISVLFIMASKAHTKSNFSRIPAISVQRAFAVKLSLKSKRESEKKRELGNRHLMYVLTLLNTINIQAHQSVQTVVNREAGKPW